jgi:hypothetical protein
MVPYSTRADRKTVRSPRTGSNTGPTSSGSISRSTIEPSVSVNRTRKRSSGVTAAIRRRLTVPFYSNGAMGSGGRPLRASVQSISQIIPMGRCPFANESQSSWRQASRVDIQCLDLDQDFVFAVFCMKMRRRVVVIEHANHDAEEAADFWHEDELRIRWNMSDARIAARIVSTSYSNSPRKSVAKPWTSSAAPRRRNRCYA